MPMYSTRVVINTTTQEEQRIKAIAYFGKYTEEAALQIHKKNKYKDIILNLHYINNAVIEAKKRYFNNCSFIKIIL